MYLARDQDKLERQEYEMSQAMLALNKQRPPKGEYGIKNLKPIPKFRNEAEEQEFWSTHSSSDYFSIDDLVQLDLSALKPTSKPITLRLPTPLIYEIKVLANSQDVPYQSLMKVLLTNAVRAFKKSIAE